MDCVSIKAPFKLLNYIKGDKTVFIDGDIVSKPIKTVAAQIKLIIDIVFSKVRNHITNISRCIVFALGSKSMYKVRYSPNMVLIIISSAQDKKSTVTIIIGGKVTKSVTLANLAKPFLFGRITDVTRVRDIKHLCGRNRLLCRRRQNP